MENAPALPQVFGWTMPLAAVDGSPRDLEVVIMSESGEMLFTTVSTYPPTEGAPAAKLLMNEIQRRLRRRYASGYHLHFVKAGDPRVAEAVKKNKALGEEGDRRL